MERETGYSTSIFSLQSPIAWTVLVWTICGTLAALGTGTHLSTHPEPFVRDLAGAPTPALSPHSTTTPGNGSAGSRTKRSSQNSLVLSAEKLHRHGTRPLKQAEREIKKLFYSPLLNTTNNGDASRVLQKGSKV